MALPKFVEFGFAGLRQPIIVVAEVMMNMLKTLRQSLFQFSLTALICWPSAAWTQEISLPQLRKTSVSIVGDEFWINGQPTYAGRKWKGHKMEGLLINTRMVQGIFDDRNTNTVKRWAYPDTGQWDAERNTREFIEAMPQWKSHGVLAFSMNLQGGCPERYAKEQPWHNSGIEADGSLNTNYMQRLERILDRADELGLVVILGVFYFGQDQRLKDEAAVVRALDNVLGWLFEHSYRNVLLEVNNECNVRYEHDILKPERVHELINRVRDTTRNARRFYVGTSYGGGTIPQANVARVSDFLLMHGNGVSDPDQLAEMVRKARAVSGSFTKPILFNEDDHFDFDKSKNNFVAAISQYASWGYFDPGTNNYSDGYQSPPVNWGLNTERKRAFFRLTAEMTSAEWLPPEAEVLPKATSPGVVSVTRGEYHGWTNCYFLHNGQAVVVVVPAIGRVMQFGFAGEEGVFWENRKLDGQAANWEKGWVNFGGDKAWPSPEADWWKFTQLSEWRPPPAFDGLPVQAALDGTDVVLTSAVDPYYSIKTKRRVHLDPNKPVLTITTTFDRVAGDPAQIGVWVVTQLKDPKRVYAPLTAKPTSTMPKKFVLLGKNTPPDLTVEPTLLALSRSSDADSKIGTEAGTLLWVGEKFALRIDSPRMPNVLYPDKGSSAEVYTNPDPLKYVELETLGPLYMMKGGHRIEHVNTYTLHRRTETRPDAEARRILWGGDSLSPSKR